MSRHSHQEDRTRQNILFEATRAIRVPERIGFATIMSKAGLTQGGFYPEGTARLERTITAMLTKLGHDDALNLVLSSGGHGWHN